MNLLALISEHLPIDSREWDTVVEELSTMGHEGHEAQTVQSVRQKIQELQRKKAPTGDPTCPQHILEAKDIHRRIGNRADVGTGDKEYNFVTNQFGLNEDNQLEYAVDDVEVLADVFQGFTLLRILSLCLGYQGIHQCLLDLLLYIKSQRELRSKFLSHINIMYSHRY